VLEVFRRLSAILNVAIEPMITGRFRAGDVRHCFADASRARSLLGWEPRVPLDEGLKDLVRWCLRFDPDARDLVDTACLELKEKNLLR
jgi:dTDP-L-rhamnose 4-epimerase